MSDLTSSQFDFLMVDSVPKKMKIQHYLNGVWCFFLPYLPPHQHLCLCSDLNHCDELFKSLYEGVLPLWKTSSLLSLGGFLGY